MAPFFIGLLSVLLGIVSVLIVLVVLMQRPKQEGLGAAFGGGMTDQMFGAQTTNVLQKGTVYLAVMFFVFSMVISVLTAKSVREDSDTIDAIKDAPAPPPIESEGTPGLGDLSPGSGGTTPPVQIPTSPLSTEPAGSPGGASEPADAGTEPAESDAGDAALPDSATEVPEVIEETVDEVIEEPEVEVPAVIEEDKPGE